MTPEQMIERWTASELAAADLGAGFRIVWGGFSSLRDNIMGETFCSANLCGLNAHIYLNALWVDHPGILRDAVLWHETAHALNWVIDGGSGHGAAWLKRVWSRPGYAILDYVASFAFAYWSRRHERVRDRRYAPLDG